MAAEAAGADVTTVPVLLTGDSVAPATTEEVAF